MQALESTPLEIQTLSFSAYFFFFFFKSFLLPFATYRMLETSVIKQGYFSFIEGICSAKSCWFFWVFAQA